MRAISALSTQRLRFKTPRVRLVLGIAAATPTLMLLSIGSSPRASAAIGFGTPVPTPICVHPPGLPPVCAPPPTATPPPPPPTPSPTLPPPTPAPTTAATPPALPLSGMLDCPYQDYPCDPTQVDPNELAPYEQQLLYAWIAAFEQWLLDYCTPTC